MLSLKTPRALACSILYIFSNYLTILNVHMKIINLNTLMVQKLRMMLDVLP